MNGKENIINKILSDADERCAEIVADAERRAAQTVGAAEEAVKRDREALDGRLQAVLQEKLRNARANAQLDGRKYRLEVRQRLVTECYDEVHRRLAAMNEEDRLDFIGELLSKFAEDGEIVYVTKADSKGVTPAWLKGFDKNLTLGSKYIRAEGGVVLEGDGYEKDLTVASVVRYLREKTEGAVADALGVRDE